MLEADVPCGPFTQEAVRGQLGFESAKALTEYVQNQCQAEQQQKDAERERLSEVERREQAATERERQAREREAAATAREQDAARRAALVGLGATGAELEDAVVLLAREIEQDADETALAQAAEELKQRRPELFGTAAPQAPAPPPSGSPAGVPARSGGIPPRPGQLGLDIARRRLPPQDLLTHGDRAPLHLRGLRHDR